MGPDRRLRCRREAARDGRGRNGAVHGGLGNWDGILRIRVEIAATEARRLGLALSALTMAAWRRASGRDHPRGTQVPTPIRPWAIPAAACRRALDGSRRRFPLLALS